MITLGLILAGVMVLVVIAALLVVINGSPRKLDPAEGTRAKVKLHAIQRRLDVAQVRGELRRDSEYLRQELAEELKRAVEGRE